MRWVDVQLQYLWKEKGVFPATAGFNMHATDVSGGRFFMCASALTRSLVSIWARFLWMILTMPGGWIQASPSTCTGTPSSPRIVIFTWRHWEAAEQKTTAVRCGGLSAFYQLTPSLDLLCPLLMNTEQFMWKTSKFKDWASPWLDFIPLYSPQSSEQTTLNSSETTRLCDQSQACYFFCLLNFA